MSDRVRVRYTSDDPSPVMVSPAAEAAPTSRLTPGDVIEVSGDYAADVMLATDDAGERRDPRWELVGDDVELVDTSPIAGMTGPQLRAFLADAGVDAPRGTKVAALAELAAEVVAANPQPLGADPSVTLAPLDDPEVDAELEDDADPGGYGVDPAAPNLDPPAGDGDGGPAGGESDNEGPEA